MPLTCPLRTAPSLYDLQTCPALTARLDAMKMAFSPSASPLAHQLVWATPTGRLGRGFTMVPHAFGPRIQTACASILAQDTTLEALLARHLQRMRADLEGPFALHALYYPDAIGLIWSATARRVDTWTRRTIGRGVRLICRAAGSQAEAIARHESYRAMTRDFGETVRSHDADLADVLRFPGSGALLPRPRRAPTGSAMRSLAAGDLLADL